MIFHFLYHDGGELVFDATSVHHYTGHAVVHNGVIISNTARGKWVESGWAEVGKDEKPYHIDKHFAGDPKAGTKFIRFNIALTDRLFGMYPELKEGDPIPNDK